MQQTEARPLCFAVSHHVIEQSRNAPHSPDGRHAMQFPCDFKLTTMISYAWPLAVFVLCCH